ncbi:MAG: enolase C-terminal domain-like protein [Elusimicrobia bacterium]|nr:enolase C-terminal domain-like protein [Elusimicrobiota bacterium]
MRKGAEIVAIDSRPARVAMNEPFAIAGGSSAELETVFTRLTLADGTVGHGEASPFPAFNGETAAKSELQIRRAGARWRGQDAAAWRTRLEELEDGLPKHGGAARAALGVALLDAWTRRAGLPLRTLFGGASDRVVSDVTVTLGSTDAAYAAARRIRALGVRVIKIKVGYTAREDAARVAAVAKAHPRAALTLDANQGYGPSHSLALVSLLRARGIRPVMFEQPAEADDLKGLIAFHRKSGIPVAADESLRSRADALKLAQTGAAQVLNLKLMKMGVLEAWDCGLIARASGLGVMVGGMVETPLAMGAAAHLAAGLGGVKFVDLDTPLWLSNSPTRGVGFGPGGVYDLSGVKAGIGVVPLAWGALRRPASAGRRASAP